MTSFDTVISACEASGTVKHEGHAKAMAQCPAHDDGKASLSIKHDGEKTLLHCFAGCHTDDITGALGLELKDLFDEDLSQSEPKSGPVHVRSYVYEAFNGEPWIIKDRFYPKTFLLRLPDAAVGDRRGLQGRQPILYHMPQLLAAKDQVVWIVEGEKDADTANRHGLIATTTPYGAGGRWEDVYTQALRRSGASEIRIIADQDDKGREFAAKVRASLRAVGLNVRVLRPAAGKDLTDHFEAGYTADDFLPELSVSKRPRGMDATSLLNKEMKPLEWTIPNMLPQGFAILAGNPKCGKSWTALDMALAVAMGGTVLGGIRCNQGSVLYLAREDGYRRLRSRMHTLLGREMLDHDLSRLELIPLEEEWVGGAQGIEAMEEWAEERGDGKLVILDTWAKVEPQQDNGNNAYLSDYAQTSRYKAWADRHGASVLAIHHSRKSKAEDGDVFSQISGTRGFTGAADTMFFLERGEEKTGILHLTGRDVADQQLELQRTGPLWLSVDQLEEVSW